MTNPAILEAAVRALDHCIQGYEAEAVLAAVTPLIEANALERAAKVADGFKNDLPPGIGRGIAAAIRALKEQP